MLYKRSSNPRLYSILHLIGLEIGSYIFDLGRVEELHDSGLAWLMMFQRWATKAKIGVRLMNCRSDVWEQCIKAGLEMGSVAPHLSIHAVSAHTVYIIYSGPVCQDQKYEKISSIRFYSIVNLSPLTSSHDFH